MKLAHPALKSALLALAMLLAAWPNAPAFAKDKGEWSVKGKLLGEDGKKSEDVSGIACTTDKGFPRFCLAIDDNVQFAQAVTLNDGRIDVGNIITLIEDKWNGKALELDGEGVAYAVGNFYVIGSHGHPRDKKHKLDPVKDAEQIAAKIAASSKLVRVRVDPANGAIAPGGAADVTATPKLRDLIAAEPVLAKSMDQRLDNNGVTIEGIAIQGDRLFVGFRGPFLDGDMAPVLSASLGFFFDGKPADAKLHRLPLGPKNGVRDLAVTGSGLLVLAGPSPDVVGRYSIYRWDGTSDAVKLLQHLPEIQDDGETVKPEVILPLDSGPAGLRVLIMSDGAKEGAPREFHIPQ